MRTERAVHSHCPQPERRTGPKVGIKGTQMRAFNTEGKAEPKPGVGITRELMGSNMWTCVARTEMRARAVQKEVKLGRQGHLHR